MNPLFEWVLGIDEELVPAGNVSRAFDLWDDRGISTEARGRDHTSGKSGSHCGTDGRVLLSRMHVGSVAELPEPLDRRTNNGIAFQLYRDRPVTLVFWQEGNVVCVLAGDGDPEAVVQLAFAKAVRLLPKRATSPIGDVHQESRYSRRLLCSQLLNDCFGIHGTCFVGDQPPERVRNRRGLERSSEPT